MATYAHVRVPLPEGGILKARQRGAVRVYKVLRAYRNAKGQPTNDRRLIGRLDEETGTLIPNDAYYELYAAEGAFEELPAEEAVTAPAAAFLVARTLTDLGAAAMLERALGGRDARLAGSAAAYMATRGNVMEGAGDWSASHAGAGPAITSQSSSALFARIGREQRSAFFAEWVASLCQREYLAYDVTSLSSYSKGVADLEWGHNRDGERLPQVNVGMYVGQESRLPAFYCTYPGSIVDVSHLPSMLAESEELGIDVASVTFVMDRGFCSTANARLMQERGLRFVMGVEIRHKACRRAVEGVLGRVLDPANRLPGGVHGAAVRGTFYGVRSTMHVLFDEAAAARRREDVYQQVALDADELSQRGELTAAERRRLSRYHDLRVEGGRLASFSEDVGKVAAATRYCGYFCLLTNDASLTTADVLRVYRDRDVVEQGFDELKNHVDMARMRVHGDRTLEGKAFCAFLALVFTMRLQSALAPLMGRRHLTKRDVIRELDKLKVVRTASGRRLMNPVTKLQREILEGMGTSEADLRAYVASL